MTDSVEVTIENLRLLDSCFHLFTICEKNFFYVQNIVFKLSSVLDSTVSTEKVTNSCQRTAQRGGGHMPRHRVQAISYVLKKQQKLLTS